MIVWEEENNKFFGLDFSTLKGKWKDFNFDIRYDYDGNSRFKPIDCTIWLTIYLKNSKIKSTFSKDIEVLKQRSNNFLKELQKQFNNAKF